MPPPCNALRCSRRGLPCPSLSLKDARISPPMRSLAWCVRASPTCRIIASAVRTCPSPMRSCRRAPCVPANRLRCLPLTKNGQRAMWPPSTVLRVSLATRRCARALIQCPLNPTAIVPERLSAAPARQGAGAREFSMAAISSHSMARVCFLQDDSLGVRSGQGPPPRQRDVCSSDVGRGDCPSKPCEP